jgi:zinc transporter 9
MAGGSEKAVYTALVANSLVMVCKFGAFAATGSAAMLSEAIHSLADVGNQGLLALGLKRSEAQATPEHPYGFSRERFIWALISAVGLFFLGCGVTVYHGISSLLSPHGGQEHLSPSILGGVLLFALVVEGWALLVALRTVSELRGDTPLLAYLKTSTDPMTTAVILEDSVAVLGVLVAAVCIGLSIWLQSPVPDAIGSIVIGLMMGVMAVLLVNRNRELLLGEAPDPAVIERISEIITAQPEVKGIHDVKAIVLGAGRIRFKAEVNFDAAEITRLELEKLDLEALAGRVQSPADLRAVLAEFGETMVEAIGETVDRIEERAAAQVPELAHMDLEAD